uniref:muscarinic acetylcholine receptor M4 n=1 Tax=Centroberyx gerrardi TaxID=166262 RepID=UPI003AAA622A
MGQAPELNTSSWLRPCVNGSSQSPTRAACPYSMVQRILIVMVTASLSVITVLGNMLVILSIKVNRHLRTVNNYFLLSLAVADLIIGLVSMNLYTLYLVWGHWPLGAVACDLWLVLDYVVSNASVMNLLIISLDRYFCMTRPLSYPARRTGRMAGLMIAAAWLLSFVLWAPAILCWQAITGKRIVPDGECYIQLLASPAVTLVTSLPSFYLPALIMIGLYSRVSAASRSRLTALRSDQETPAAGGASCTLPSSPRFHPQTATQHSREEDDSSVPKIQNDSSPHIQHRRGASAALSTFPSFTKCQERRRRRIVARERKVTKTILAILLAFILTWTPYNIMAVIGTFCRFCIPDPLWTTGYWLCYINSAINPGCYALCNVTFRKTFRSLLRCHSRKLR